MTIETIRAQDQRQREIDYVESVRRTLKQPYEDAVPVPPTWLCVTLGVIVAVIVVWQGGIAW